MKSSKASLLSDLNQHEVRHRIKAVKQLSILTKAAILLKEVQQVPGTCQGEKKKVLFAPLLEGWK